MRGGRCRLAGRAEAAVWRAELLGANGQLARVEEVLGGGERDVLALLSLQLEVGEYVAGYLRVGYVVQAHELDLAVAAAGNTTATTTSAGSVALVVI